MRPTGDTGNFAVATEVREGRTKVIVTALDEDDVQDNRIITAKAIGPDLDELPIVMEQTATNRYIGEFPSKKSGNYLVSVSTGAGHAPIRIGVNVDYAPEYRDRETNVALLESIAELRARGGQPGKIYMQGLDPAAVHEPGAQNPFRRDLPPVVASRPIWPWLVVAGSCLFWCDVLTRRVYFNFAWLGAFATATLNYVLNRAATAPQPQTLERLQSRKRAVHEQLASQHSRRRVEDEPSDESLPAASALVREQTSPQPRPADEEAQAESTGPESPTSRLLKAKRDFWRDRDA
jgi:hypothetical protein